MKKLFKLFGIITLIIIIGFSMIACNPDDDDDPDPDLTGTITIEYSSLVAPTTLTANYSGTETVTYQWKIGNTNLGTSTTQTADQAGNYTVTVSATGFKSKTSTTVTVTSSGGGNTFTVTFNSNGGSDVAQKTGVTSDSKITAPANPIKENVLLCKFDGWYKENTLENKWDFNEDTVTESITLFAKWVAYQLGDVGPGGGRIFFVSSLPTGFSVEGYGSEGQTGYFTAYNAYYLEAAPANYTSTVQWGASGEIVTGVTTDNTENNISSTSLATNSLSFIGKGRKDTMLIVAHLGTNEEGRAAQVAIIPQGGKDDWFLPSLGELCILYENRTHVGIGDTGYYWSSSQRTTNTTAWVINFMLGLSSGRTMSAKTNENNVRAIRAF